MPDVRDYAKSLPCVAYAEDNLYTCSQDTQKKIIEKIKEHNLNRVILGGGVSCNSRLRERFRKALADTRVKLYCPSPLLCTDNAAMVACLGYYKSLKKDISTLEVEAAAQAG